MSDKDNDNFWHPEHGPPPTADERADATALAEALEASFHGRTSSLDPDLEALLDTALRVHATAHPDPTRDRAVAAAAVQYAITRASTRWYRYRWRWLAAVTLAMVGLAGLHLTVLRPLTDPPRPVISRPASDVFTKPLPEDPRSTPIDDITDARMRAYRDNVLFNGVSDWSAP